MIKYFKWIYYKTRYGLPDRWHRMMFLPAIKSVINTPPIFGVEDGLAILTMVSHKDMLMYLLAMKSLHRFLQRGRFVVLNDGTLSVEDIETIKKHIKGVQLTDFEKINNDKCPKKNCWERLLCAAELSQREQVLVVDSDILTHGDISEVKEPLNKNQNFIIGVGQEIQPMLDIWKAETDKNRSNPISAFDIQTFVDTHLNLIPESQKLKYLKATAGFNGFAKGVITRQLVEHWSRKMEDVFDERWHRWGSEQIMACFLVANYGETVVLQEPKYGLYYALNERDYDEMSVIHFIGSHRYKKGYYAKVARQVIRKLKHEK